MSDGYDEDYCPVCRGSKKIRVPLMHQLKVMESQAAEPVLEDAWRDYDCPECVLRIKAERFKAGKYISFMDRDQTSPAAKEWWHKNAREHMARMIAEGLIKDGFIEFTDLPETPHYAGGVQASFYAALPKHWEPLEQRIAERQMEVADEVATEAKRLIDNWGSYYDWRSIHKSDARREINDAVRAIRARRAKT